MSLRAIQKRDREKLSSSQKQQFISQHQQQQLRGGGPGVGATPMTAFGVAAPIDDDAGTTTTTASMTAMKMTGYGPDGPMMVAAGDGGGRLGGAAAAVPSVQSIIQSQNAKRKQKQTAAAGAATANDAPTTQRPPTTSALRRSSSYPTLCARRTQLSSGKQPPKLRTIKSESDLCRSDGTTGAGGSSPFSGVGGSSAAGGSSSFSTNNLYLGAKSEVCLKTLAVKNMQQSAVQLFGNGGPPGSIRSTNSIAGGGGGGGGGGSSGGTSQPSRRLYESRRASELSGSDFVGAHNKISELHLLQHKGNGSAVRIPIVGYEVMEERARFTIFKLRIENSISHTCWLVLRRYTDFVRLNNKLRTFFPHCPLVLPRKKWFGDNFSSGFIDNRIQGLQTFIDTILGDDLMRTCQAVRDFFCLDEPPSYSESMEESRVIFEAQEETISQLKQQLQTKEDLVSGLQTKLATEIARNQILTNVIGNSVENCAKCSKSIDQHLKDAIHK